MLRILMAAIFALHVGVALAEESIGTIEGTLDGEQRTWIVYADDGDSDWTGGGDFPALGIVGHVEGTDSNDFARAIDIGFNVYLKQQPLEFQDPHVNYFDTSILDGYFSSPDTEPAQFTITSLQVIGDKLAIKGTFTSKLYFSNNMGRNLDMSKSKSVTGTYDVTLPRK